MFNKRTSLMILQEAEHFTLLSTLNGFMFIQTVIIRKLSMFDIFQNYVCGCISGYVQVIVMQPFEIIKTRLQTQNHKAPQYTGIIDCLKKIYKQEGLLSFYKGTLVPILGVGAQVSIQFGSNELSKTSMQYFQADDDEEILPMKFIVAAGMLTGIPSTIAITPIDHLRILMQIQHGSNQKYHGSVDAGIQVYKRHGIKGLYKGFSVTLLRQVLAMGVYFSFYQWGMRQLAPQGQDSQSAPILGSFFVGGFAGMLSWLFTYPIDYVKTLVQSDDLDNKKYRSAWQCCRERYTDQGFRTFFRGLGITMLRSFPVNGIGFLAFQFAMRHKIPAAQQIEVN